MSNESKIGTNEHSYMFPSCFQKETIRRPLPPKPKYISPKIFSTSEWITKQETATSGENSEADSRKNDVADENEPNDVDDSTATEVKEDDKTQLILIAIPKKLLLKFFKA